LPRKTTQTQTTEKNSPPQAYSREDKYVPSLNFMAPAYDKLIKESTYLSTYKQICVFPYIPRDFDVTNAMSIGKVPRDCPKQSGHFNYPKESIVSGAAFTGKGVLFPGWKLPDLIASINLNFKQHHHYIECYHRIDHAIKGWHKSRLEAYTKHWEAQTSSEIGATIEIDFTPKKNQKAPQKLYEVFLDPIAKSTITNNEQTS
jgi:hypothetical protein